ncbi:hypothetical protein [Virgibacillus halodenitrificans]|uniref:hypothetical protein n=1 Tax=Virgibacillus halodenitrificans TaxID=1482 RepID=UPI000EF4D479|nr:hypothetical protein [Virgibacillus halodenitrificans]
MKKHNKIGRLLYYFGIFVCAVGIALELVEDTPETLSILAMPLMIIGVILLIASNFFKKVRDMD